MEEEQEYLSLLAEHDADRPVDAWSASLSANITFGFGVLS